MSELRKQLDAEKAAYRAARYEGDLARDVMGSRWATAWWLGPAVGIAAAVVLAVSLWPRNEQPPIATKVAQPALVGDDGGATAVTTTQVAPVEDSVWSIPTMPNMTAAAPADVAPSGGSLAVPAVPVTDVGGMPEVGGMPSFPSLSTVLAANNDANEGQQ